MSRPLTIVLAAGGTGGHVFPAVAAAEALKARGHRVIVATDGRGARFGAGVETVRIAAGGLSGGLVAKAKDAFKLTLGFTQAAGLLLKNRIDVVVGFGGYPSLPTLLAAIVNGRPTVLHEQNAVLGRVNRLLAKLVDRIATALTATEGAPADRLTLIGNPVRQAIATVGKAPYAPPANDQPIELLIFGGSQGARVLSDVLPKAVAGLPAEIRDRLRVTQQCRPEDLARVTTDYESIGLPAELKTFFDDMPERLAAAHLVVARSGASTVAELAAAGRPSLLIPFAAAMDDHQTANARALTDSGAADRIAEADTTPETVSGALARLLADPSRLAAMAAAAKTVARPDAADALADLIEATAASRRAGAQNRPVRGLAA